MTDEMVEDTVDEFVAKPRRRATGTIKDLLERMSEHSDNDFSDQWVFIYVKCNTCDKIKPRREFSKGQSALGLRANCKDCDKHRSNDRRVRENREKEELQRQKEAEHRQRSEQYLAELLEKEALFRDEREQIIIAHEQVLANIALAKQGLGIDDADDFTQNTLI